MASIPAILEVPPPEVAELWRQVLKPTFVIGGWLWILSYVLLARENMRSKSYGMPLFALANNLAWELIYAFYFHDVWFKRLVFTIWVCLEIPIVFGTIRNSKYEWSHTPIVHRHFGKILIALTLWCAIGHWSFLHWWFEWNISAKKGKFYRGVEGPDPTELKWWSGEFCQMTLSLTSLVQLITRQHTQGVTWAIWATRAIGSSFEPHFHALFAWLYWREPHEFLASPISIFLSGTAIICDLVYPFVFAHIRRRERNSSSNSGATDKSSSTKKLR